MLAFAVPVAAAAAAAVLATLIEAAVAEVPWPHAARNIDDKTNTAVAALDNFMRLLLVERVPYVAVRRHYSATRM